jgi:hypothetical protein
MSSKTTPENTIKYDIKLLLFHSLCNEYLYRETKILVQFIVQRKENEICMISLKIVLFLLHNYFFFRAELKRLSSKPGRVLNEKLYKKHTD